MLGSSFTSKLYFFFLAILAIVLADFDWKTANTSIWLSAGAYCPAELYLNRTYLGYSAGFVPTHRIIDEASDTSGYIGYIKEQSTIYIVMRGSVSFQNWVSDFDALQVPYNHTDCTECLVHKGFNYAWNQVATKVVEDVLALHKEFPDYSIVVTGHSLGGALASLCAVSLQEVFNAAASVSNKFTLRAMQKLHVIPKVRLFSFGAPRFSNAPFAAYVTKLLPERNRITHYKDLVPHVPPNWRYLHIEGEWYEDEFGAVHACTGPEDLLCSDQWYYTSVADHMRYLSLPIGCLSVSDGLYRSVFIEEPEEVRSRDDRQDRRNRNNRLDGQDGRRAGIVPEEYYLARQIGSQALPEE